MKISQCLNHGKMRWRVFWRAGGKQNRRFFKNRKDAEGFAKDTTAEIKQFGKDWMALSGSDRSEMIQWWRRSKERGYHISEACRFWESHGAKTAGDISIAKICSRFLAAKLAKGLRPESLRLLETTLDQFKLGRETRKAAEVTTEDVSEWLDAHSHHWGPWRRRGALIDLGNLFNWGIGQKLLTSNPVAAIERPIIEHRTPDILTTERAKALLKLCRDLYPALLPWLVISLFSGLRAAELERLHWENIVGSNIILASHQTKGRARRLVSIRPTLKAWLEDCRKPRGPVWLPEHRRLAIEFRAKAGGLPRNVLRHSFISYALGAGETVDKVAMESGNSPEIVFRFYREIVTAEQAKEFWALMPD